MYAGYSNFPYTPEVSLSTSELRKRITGRAFMCMNRIIPVDLYGQNQSTIRFNTNIVNKMPLYPFAVYEHEYEQIFIQIQGVVGNFTYQPDYVTPIDFVAIQDKNTKISVVNAATSILDVEKKTSFTISDSTDLFMPCPMNARKYVFMTGFTVPNNQEMKITAYKYIYTRNIINHTYDVIKEQNFIAGSNHDCVIRGEIQQGEIISIKLEPTGGVNHTINFYKFLFI